MGKPRTPTNVLDARGAFRKDPQRFEARKDEPQPIDGIGSAPDYFTPEQISAWDFIVAKAHAGTLSDADSVVVEQGAILLAEMRANPAGFPITGHARLQGVLASLGMTPADRSRVSVKKQLQTDPLAGLLKAKR